MRPGCGSTAQETGSSLACPQYHHHHRDQAHSRLTSAITAPQTPRWRPPAPGDYASQPLTGTRRAALLGTCARARAPRRHAPSTGKKKPSTPYFSDSLTLRFPYRFLLSIYPFYSPPFLKKKMSSFLSTISIRGRMAPSGARPSTGPEKRSAPRAGQRLAGVVASRWRPPARSLRGRDRRG